MCDTKNGSNEGTSDVFYKPQPVSKKSLSFLFVVSCILIENVQRYLKRSRNWGL